MVLIVTFACPRVGANEMSDKLMFKQKSCIITSEDSLVVTFSNGKNGTRLAFLDNKKLLIVHPSGKRIAGIDNISRMQYQEITKEEGVLTITFKNSDYWYSGEKHLAFGELKKECWQTIVGRYNEYFELTVKGV